MTQFPVNRRNLLRTVGTTALGTHALTQAGQVFSSNKSTTTTAGDILWVFGPLDEPPGAIQSSPTVVDGTVYVGCGSRRNRLYALDAATGEQRWSMQASDAIHSAPAVVDDTVYVGDLDGTVSAVDTDTGTAQWTFSTKGNASIFASLTVFDGTVYVPDYDNRLYALNAATGEKQWSYRAFGGFHASPAVANGTVYAPSFPGKLHALDADTGKKQWKYASGSARTIHFPTVVDDTVYIVTSSGASAGNIVALDSVTGEATTILENVNALNGPTVADDTLYVPEAKGMTAVDLQSNEKKWTYETPESVHTAPTIVDNTIIGGAGQLFGAEDTYLYGLDAATGTEQWRIETNKACHSSAIVVDGIAYIGSLGRRMYAIDVGTTGSSRGSRVLNGVTNHHYGWDGGPVETSKLTGVVTDTQQTPHSGVTITLSADGTTATVTTGQNGTFSLEPDPGTYTLTAERIGLEPETTTVTLERGVPAFEQLMLAALDPGTVTGTLNGPEGTSVAGVTVTISSDATVIAEAVTDDTGAYETEVPPGEYRLTATTDDLSGWQDVTVTEAETVTAPVTLTDELLPFPGNDNPPQDLDGDGRFEDIDGDGELTIFDVQVFFTTFQSEQVQTNPNAFKFNASQATSADEVTIFDVQALFTQLVE